MPQPQVRDLNKLIKTIGQSVNPQKKLIDSDIAANNQSGADQVAGLNNAKNLEFGNIEQLAQDKGQFFSGFSPDEQAKYTGSTYLPALANLQSTIAQTRSGLLGKKADLDTNVFNQAFQTREGDIDKQFSWQNTQEQRQFETEQAEIQRRFTAAESDKDRTQARQLQALSAAAKAPKGPSTAQVVGSIVGELQKVAGKDGYVNPKSYNDGRQAWVALGGKASDYDGTFRGFANPSHLNDYLASGF